MNVKTLLTTTVATAAIVGTIGLAYAQTDTTNRNPDGTLRNTTQPSGTPGTTSSMPSTSPSTTMPNTTGTTPGTTSGASGTTTETTGPMSNNVNTTSTERAARADRN